MNAQPTREEKEAALRGESTEWEYVLTLEQHANLPPAAFKFWKPPDWINYIGENWRRRAPERKERSRISAAPTGRILPIQDIAKMSAKARAALAAQKEQK